MHSINKDNCLKLQAEPNTPMHAFFSHKCIVKLGFFIVLFVTENEDTDPSEESSKSKSSQEEKKGQGQNSRGEQ